MVEVDHPSPSLKSSPIGSRPLGVILSGGAALSAWQGGVLEALFRGEGIPWHSLMGTSGGALNAAGVFQGDLDRLVEVWTTMDRKRFFRFGPQLAPVALYRQDSLREYLGSVYDEQRCRREGKGWLYILSSDLCSYRTVQATYGHGEGAPWDSPLLEHLLGSISVPGLFPPVDFKADDGTRRLLVDGHLTSFVRLEPLIKRGVRDFLSVNVQERGGVDLSTPRRWVSTLINTLLHAQIDNGLEAARLSIRQNAIRFWELTPTRPLNISVFKFDREECRRVFKQGQEDARVFLADPDRFWRSF